MGGTHVKCKLCIAQSCESLSYRLDLIWKNYRFRKKYRVNKWHAGRLGVAQIEAYTQCTTSTRFHIGGVRLLRVVGLLFILSNRRFLLDARIGRPTVSTYK